MSETFLVSKMSRLARPGSYFMGTGVLSHWYLHPVATELRAGRSGDRIPVGRDFPPVQTDPGAHLASCTMGTGSFPGVKYGRGVLLTTQPLLVPRSWKTRAIPLLTLWATPRPVTGTLYFCLYCMLLSDRTMALELSQPLTEMSTRNISWG